MEAATAPALEPSAEVRLKEAEDLAIRAVQDAQFWRSLATRNSHPLRVRILEMLRDECRLISPIHVSRTIGGDVNLIAYHFRVLADQGWIELVKEEPRRGATEHFYQAAEPARRAG